MESWITLKAMMSGWLDGNNLALVIMAAVMIQFVTAIALRRGLTHPLPWATALAAVATNELLSMVADRHILKGEEIRALRDIAVGMAVPTLLILTTRYHPIMFTPAAAAILNRGRLDRAASREEPVAG